MVVFERPIKFEDVDAAGIVFFARFANYAHEAMEHFFAPLAGGYAGLIMDRRIGFPAVDLKMSFKSPARYGDTLRIETRVGRVGNRSAVFRYRMLNVGTGKVSAEIEHTVVISDLRSISSCDMPPDVRARLLEHLDETPAT
ncbi:1,4-dihydroxy-2-naphthoyl-CoA hydrolase [Minicystis rosea]|nr:1,4-dihydroxy-2-naphthoyl-CoA hydrolase [Minicystis rosea]